MTVTEQIAVNGADKYQHDGIAAAYDGEREDTPKWIAEQRIIEAMLSDLPAGTEVLDVPVGTGRFIPFYAQKGFRVIGLDKSRAMCRQAQMKADSVVWPGRPSVRVGFGDVRTLALPDKRVGVSLMVRLTRWLSPHECTIAMLELQRVTRKRIIWTARVEKPSHPELARPVALFEKALHDGWRITRNEEGYQPSYRILMAECA